MLREDAYQLIQSHAMQAWNSDGDFRAAVQADPAIKNHLKPEQFAHAFSLERQLKHVDTIFARVFGQ